MFFSEEKNQKTFTSGAHGQIQAMAGEVGAAENQKSFAARRAGAAFLQKRSLLFFHQ
jgi:hypothetical protein